MISRGTKSVLFGVHAAWFHPASVLLAWRRLYGSWPAWWQLVAIVTHDWGYFQRPDIDGASGKQHPHRGAVIASRIVGFFRGTGFDVHTYYFSLLHSRHTAREMKMQPSKLCAADKFSVFYDPPAWYLFRARLSGEIREFKQRAISAGHIPADSSDRQWFDYYRADVLARPEIQALLTNS